MTTTEEALRGMLRSEKAVIGTDRTLKELKQGALASIYLAKNCPAETQSDIQHYSKIAGVEVHSVGVMNNELGTLCRKPFSVSVVGLLK